MILANKNNYLCFPSKLNVFRGDHPSISSCLIEGLHYLKQAFNESDETVK